MKKKICYALYLLIVFTVGLIVSHDLDLLPYDRTWWIIGMAPIITFCLGMAYAYFDKKEE